jgi:hypothetical protein
MDDMNGTPIRLLALSVLSLSATSLTIIFGQCPPEPEEPVSPLVYEVEGPSLSQLIALRIVAKSRITRDVIAGRLSLVAAAALFGALNRLPPQATPLAPADWSGSLLGAPARTEEERLCWQVVEYVRWTLVEEPDRAEDTVVRLNADFKRELDKKGSIHLPDPSAIVSVQELLKQARAQLTETQRGAHRGVNSLQRP